MTTEIWRVRILWIFQITKITCAKSPIQNCLSGGFQERVGVIGTGYEVPKNPVFMRVCGHYPNGQIVFATFLQHLESKKYFATDEIMISGFEVKP